MTLAEVLKYIETAPRDELLKIRNLSTRLAYPSRRGVVGTVEGVKIVNYFEVYPEAYGIAKALQVAVKLNFPFVKDVPVERWADDIDKLHRVDGYDWNIISAVTKWSQQDDFWKQNVRSGSALRRHFEKMLVKIKSSGAYERPREV